MDPATDRPTDPRRIDPGGTDLPPPAPQVDADPVDAALLSPADFVPGTEVLVPSGAKARVQANIAALKVVTGLRETARAATRDEQTVLAAWSGWGAVPEVFDKRNDRFTAERAALAELLSRDEYQRAEASILNAHYTDPAVAAVMWEALLQAGFTGGRVLEPGCGSGTFIGHAPASAVMVGVEVDPITAGIAAALYPSAQIRNEGFEQTRVPEGSFAATIGNVPFGRYVVHDPAYNPTGQHSIHNAFILKSLALTAPGGVVAVLTSRWTLDAVSDKARVEMAQRADLITALRLPSQAFSRVAGTEAVTDLLILRRRTEPRAAEDKPVWLQSTPMEIGEERLDINAYFQAHPGNVLGQIAMGHGLYGSANLVVAGRSGTELAEQMRELLEPIIAAAVADGRGLTATPETLTTVSERSFDPGLLTPADHGEQTPLYTLRYNAEQRRFEEWTGHTWESRRVPRSREAETRQLIDLRDAANTLITAQRDGRSVAERHQIRGHLNYLYDRYVRVHGPLNRFTWVIPADITQDVHDRKVAELESKWRQQEGEPGRPYTGEVPPQLAEEWDTKAWQQRDPHKRRAHLDAFKDDPGWAVVSALEIFDEATGEARKAAIFSTDLLSAPVDASRAGSPAEALAISLHRSQHVDLPLIAELLDTDTDSARAQLNGLVYPSLEDPAELIPATRALSGNVRVKLAQAIEAAREEPLIYNDYITALKAVVPADRNAEEIKARPGAPWIPADVVAQFARETFGTQSVSAEHLAGRWVVEVTSWMRRGRLLTETWGMEGKGLDAVSLLEALCNSRSVVVNHEDGTLNTEATFAAQAKCAKIGEEFQRWVFADEERRNRLVAEYNQRFRSLVAPRHDGQHLPLPGLSEKITPHPYQRDAIARILAEPTTLIDHVVGAGKTGVMVVAAYQLRRLGLVRQPWVVVPNHICEQAGREALGWLPDAQILLGQTNTDADGRRRLIAQSAASDWDMVIVPQSMFKLIGVSEATKAKYIEEQLHALRAQMETAQTPRSKKRIELAIKNAKKRLDQKLSQANKDTGLTWEASGADYLFVDEAHHFKNLQRLCNIEELSYTQSSERAEDLALKLEVLRQRRRDEAAIAGIRGDEYVERVATFATGTPIANSLGELWVMQRYLRPDLLEAAGVAELGDWGAAFTATHSTVEVNSTGTKLRPVTRVGKYTNVPDLLAISSVFTDVVTRDQVPTTLPVLRGGRRQVISLQADTEVRDFIADLGWRMDNLDAREPARDNALKIATDGRNVSLDPQLAHMGAPQNSRAAAVADQIMRIHTEAADRVYTDLETGQPLAERGPLQIVFCDRGTPSKDPDQFTIYAAIKDELIDRGMPADKIRFVHEARKPSEMKALFTACNRGDVSVIIGSTEKMGTGANLQRRALALHHVDVPWRPADLEQREGRIIRQGNQNREIEILTYVTEGTYDTVMWQKVQAKALFIEQVRRGDTVDAEVESLDGGDIGTAAAETKAVATGDPRYLRQVELEDEVKRLVALERAYHESIRRRDWIVSGHERSIPRRRAQLAELEPIAQQVSAMTAQGHAPDIAVGVTTFPDAASAAKAFAAACRQAWDDARNRASSQFEPMGASIGGLDLVATRDHINGCLLVRLAVPSRLAEISREDLMGATDEAGGAKARGLMRRVENIWAQLPRHYDSLRLDLDRDQSEYDDLVAHPPEPFEHTATLTDRQAELASLTLELKLAAQSPEALARAAAAEERMAQRGRKPGWSLLHNPTPYLVDQHGFPDAAAMREAVKAAERAALRESLGPDAIVGYPLPGELHRMRTELEIIELAGGRSPATVYDGPRESDLYYGNSMMRMSDQVQAAVIRIIDSDMSVQPLRVHERWEVIPAERHAIMDALAKTVWRNDLKLLTIPASPTAALSRSATYCRKRATAAEAIANFDSGQWKLPPGALLIVDDADHLDADQLRWFTRTATATNTKLLLVTDETSAPGPNRPLTTALAEALSWSHYLGTPPAREVADSALTRVSRYLSELHRPPDDDAHREAAALIARRDTLAAAYTRLAAPAHVRDTGRDGPQRDAGLSL